MPVYTIILLHNRYTRNLCHGYQAENHRQLYQKSHHRRRAIERHGNQRISCADFPKGVIKYYLYYRIYGKQRNFLLGSANALTPAQARDLAKEKAGQVAAGEDVQVTRHEAKKREQRNSLTLSKFLEEHYSAYLMSINAKTAQKSLMCIQSNFKHLSTKPLVEITAWDIQQWVAERSKAGRAPATISYAYNRLRAVFNRAVEWGFIDSHSLDNVKIPRIDNKRIRYLSVSEEAVLLDSLKVRDARLKDEAL